MADYLSSENSDSNEDNAQLNPDETDNSARTEDHTHRAPRPEVQRYSRNRFNVPLLTREEGRSEEFPSGPVPSPSSNRYVTNNNVYRRRIIPGYPEGADEQPTTAARVPDITYMSEVRTQAYRDISQSQIGDRSRSRPRRSETITSGAFMNLSAPRNQGNLNSPSVPPPRQNRNLIIPLEQVNRSPAQPPHIRLNGTGIPAEQGNLNSPSVPPRRQNNRSPAQPPPIRLNGTGIPAEQRNHMRSNFDNRTAISNFGMPRQQVVDNSRRNESQTEPFPPFPSQDQMRRWEVNPNVPRGFQSCRNELQLGSDHVSFSRTSENGMGMQQFLQSSVGMSPSQLYFQRERNLQKKAKKYVQEPSIVPRKKTKYNPYVNVVIKEGVLADNSLKVNVKRGSRPAPYRLWKIMRVVDASDHLRGVLNLHETQGLWIEHLDTEDCLLWDLDTIQRKLSEAGYPIDNVTIGMLADTLLFKSVSVYGRSGQHLLLKKTTPRDFEEIENWYDDSSNDEQEAAIEGKQEHPNIENDTGNGNGVKQEHPDVEIEGNGTESKGEDSTISGNDRVEDVYLPIIRDLLESNPEDVLLSNVSTSEEARIKTEESTITNSSEEVTKSQETERIKPLPKYEPQMNGVAASDHFCDLFNCGAKFENPRGDRGTVRVEVDRNDVVKSLHTRYKSLLENGGLEKTLTIVFKNEPAMDYGGVTREFNSVLIEESKKAGIIEGNEVEGYTFIPKFSLREEIECVSYFLFKTGHCIKPLLPQVIIAILFQKHLPENDQWVAALESLPSTTGSETLTNLKVMHKMGIEDLEVEQPAVYMSLQGECDMALGCGKLRKGMEHEIITTLFQFEICSRQLWLFNAVRAGLRKSGFLEFAEHHPSALALYSMEMRDFVVFEAEDVIGKLLYQTGSFLSADRAEENLAKDFLHRTLKMLEDGVAYHNKLEEKKLNLRHFCLYVTGAPHVVAVPDIEVQFTRQETDFFAAHVCNRQIDIPLGLEENVFSECLLEKLSHSGFTTF